MGEEEYKAKLKSLYQEAEQLERERKVLCKKEQKLQERINKAVEIMKSENRELFTEYEKLQERLDGNKIELNLNDSKIINLMLSKVGM